MKIKVVCRKQTVYRNGKSPVALRFTDQRVSRFVSAGVAIEARYWDDEHECPTENCPDCTNVKMSIDKMGANKSSYIDTFLSRACNATTFTHGLTRALDGDEKYRWFVE